MFAGFEILPDLVFPRKGLLPDNAEFGHDGTISSRQTNADVRYKGATNGRRYG
jgi:hypothetical protein